MTVAAAAVVQELAAEPLFAAGPRAAGPVPLPAVVVAVSLAECAAPAVAVQDVVRAH